SEQQAPLSSQSSRSSQFSLSLQSSLSSRSSFYSQSSSSQSSKLAPINTCFTKTNPTKKKLISEIRLLNERVKYLEEEIETLNNPGTSSLQQILKYLLHSNSPTKDLGSDQEESESQLPKRKKRKTIPFS
ncbi:11635_t:CDS:1, partial [Dentiscutata heterogama]